MRKGFFITIGDVDSLKLYLKNGLFSQRMRDYRQKMDRDESLAAHYRTIGDFACASEGDHVFFFRDRKIMYGGQVTGGDHETTFGFNGPFSPLLDKEPADIVWDETFREDYATIEDYPGTFARPDVDPYDDGEPKRYCHPYLLTFKTNEHTGKAITSDELYWELGRYRYPLMSNSIQGRAFSPLTPGEASVLYDLLRASTDTFDYSEAPVREGDKPQYFDSNISVSSLDDVVSEAHLEAEIIANPALLPESIQPDNDTAVLRQVPMTPYKPYSSQADRADVCYYGAGKNSIEDGTLPNVIIELKNKKAGGPPARQAAKYRRWLKQLVPNKVDDARVAVVAPDIYEPNFKKKEYVGDQLGKIEAWTFDSQISI